MRHTISLNRWSFSIDERNYKRSITIPHTWNVDDEVMLHKGAAKCETTAFVDKSLDGGSVTRP